eukprot:TRINITY_DN797_c0_g1_i1.p1 TRINITY_DN797_c0_g1~~TRINITY_DN797_c0_g1_i1.p1  ORF type:complete len:125 (-),score=13.07 TRINITY_DN797_c0_g1_i1:26-400(-)
MFIRNIGISLFRSRGRTIQNKNNNNKIQKTTKTTTLTVGKQAAVSQTFKTTTSLKFPVFFTLPSIIKKLQQTTNNSESGRNSSPTIGDYLLKPSQWNVSIAKKNSVLSLELLIAYLLMLLDDGN